MSVHHWYQICIYYSNFEEIVNYKIVLGVIVKHYICITYIFYFRNYRNDADFNLNARMITALAFVPSDQVAEYFDILSEELEVNFSSLQPILDWMEIYYIGIVRRLPSFLISIQ